MNSLSKLSRAPLIGLLIACLALPLIAPNYYVQFASKAMLISILAISLNLAVGFGGLVSLCHGAFFGLGGYMLGFMSSDNVGASLWLSLPATIIIVSAVAVVIGMLSLRTRGIYFIMVTLAFGEMLFYLFHDTKIGGGSDGMYIYFKPEVVVGDVTLLDLENSWTFYYLVLALLLGSIALIKTIVHSPFGHALSAAKDNERRALSLGYPVFWIRLVAFVISAALAGIAGYFSAAQFGFIAPHPSASILVMVVLGGMSSVLGPIFGALALLGLEEVLKSFFEHWKLIKGLVVIALVFALPGGLQQLTQMVWRSEQEPEPALDKTPAKEPAAHV
jgi:branched-chain amino acid transport system permease protein